MRGTNVAVYAMESRRTLPTGEQHLAGEHIVRDRTTVDIRRVLCPVDFSDFARRALDYAIAVARWYTCRLTVLYVHHVPVPSIAEFAGLATGPADGRVLSAADCEQLREQLKGLTPAEAVKNIPVEFSFAEGDVATEILAEADSLGLPEEAKEITLVRTGRHIEVSAEYDVTVDLPFKKKTYHFTPSAVFDY